MSDFALQLPKAELHVHLEGSIEAATLAEINPSITEQSFSEKINFTDFAGFLEAYKWVTRQLRTPADYALATRRLIESLHAQNVQYAEITLSAGVLLLREQDLDGIYAAIWAECQGAPVEVRWIFDAIRHLGADTAMTVAEAAVRYADRGVIGFGIGGDEVRGPAEWFSEVFALTRQHGLGCVPHAGETVGPESIWAALELGADRIGHGFRAIGDPELVKHLAKHDIPLEICITSNVCTGAVPSLADHPVRRLFDAGVPLILNTDDPALFRTTLVKEYDLAASVFGFSRSELEVLAKNSLRSRLLPPSARLVAKGSPTSAP